jgi:hypothetical protein
MSNKKTLFETGREFLEQFKMTTKDVAEILEGLHSALTEHEADKPLTKEYLAQMGFKYVTAPTFEGVSANFYYKDGIVAFVVADNIQVGAHDIINGKQYAITFRWVKTERELHQVYEAVMGKPLVASNEQPTEVHQHKTKASTEVSQEQFALMANALGVELNGDLSDFYCNGISFELGSSSDTLAYKLQRLGYLSAIGTHHVNMVYWQVTEAGKTFFRNNFQKYRKQ